MTRKNPKPENITEEMCEKEAEKQPLRVQIAPRNQKTQAWKQSTEHSLDLAQFAQNGSIRSEWLNGGLGGLCGLGGLGEPSVQTTTKQ